MKGPGKGISNNPAGKPKGTPNKAGRDLKERIAELLEGQFDRFTEAMAGLNDKDYVKAYTEIMPFALPKMASAQLTIDTNEEDKRTVRDLFPDELKDDQSESSAP